jgi:hypothetical protein
LLASTAISGMPPPMSAPVLNGVPVSGSTSLATGLVETTIGLDHVAPPSVERMTPVNEAFGASNPEPLPK